MMIWYMSAQQIECCPPECREDTCTPNRNHRYQNPNSKLSCWCPSAYSGYEYCIKAESRSSMPETFITILSVTGWFWFATCILSLFLWMCLPVSTGVYFPNGPSCYWPCCPTRIISAGSVIANIDDADAISLLGIEADPEYDADIEMAMLQAFEGRRSGTLSSSSSSYSTLRDQTDIEPAVPVPVGTATQGYTTVRAFYDVPPVETTAAVAQESKRSRSSEEATSAVFIDNIEVSHCCDSDNN